MKNLKICTNNLKSVLMIAMIAFLAISCSAEDSVQPEDTAENDPVEGDILFTLQDRPTVSFNDAVVLFSNPSEGWTTIHAQLKNEDGIVLDWITFSFEGNTLGEYERFDENVQGNYSNGNYFYWVYKSAAGDIYFNMLDFKVESMLVTDMGENTGDRIAGSFNGLVDVDGVDTEFTGEFDFLVE